MSGIERSQLLTQPASREAASRPVPGKWRAAALYTALTLVLMYPLSIHPASLIPGDGPDTQLNLWVLSWNVHAFTHQPLGIFNANDFYPQLRTLAYQDSLIGSAFIAAPVIWFTGNPVLAANVILLLATILCGVGAYTLGRRVGLSEPAALLCGLVFAFCPPRFFRYSQIPLAPVQWIPFALASLHAYLDGGRRRDLWYAAAFVSVQTLTSSHAAVFVIVAVGVVLVTRTLLGEPPRVVTRVRDLGVVGALLFLPVLLTYLPYRVNQRELGLRRDLSDWTPMYESLLASPTYVHKALLEIFGLTRVNEEAAGFLFPGYLPILLSVIALAATVAAAIRWFRTSSDSARRLRLELVLGALTAVAGAMTARHALLPEAAVNPSADWRGLLPWFVCAAVWVAVRRVSSTDARDLLARYRRPLGLMTMTVAAWTALIGVRQAVPAGQGLSARYYAGDAWSGTPAIEATDARQSGAAMSQRWPSRPAIFTARWNGFLTVGASATYRFSTTSDDGSRLWIDGKLISDNSGAHARQTVAGSVTLDAGSHAVVLEYSQLGADSWLDWSWRRDGEPERQVSGWMLSPRRTRYSTALVARGLNILSRITMAGSSAGALWWLVVMLRTRWQAWGVDAMPLRHAAAPVYLVMTVVCLGLVIGPPYGIWPHVYWWPGFSFIRAPLRFMILGVLGIAVLSAVGFDHLARRLTRPARNVAAVAVAALLLVEFFGAPIFAVPFAVTIPAADRWLASQPAPFVVAEVPVGPERYQTTYMLHSTAHWQRTVAGYGGIRPELNQIVNAELRSFPDERSVQHLLDLGVTHVIVHLDMYAPEDWPLAEERLRTFDSVRLRLEFSDGTGRVYSLHRRQS